MNEKLSPAETQVVADEAAATVRYDKTVTDDEAAFEASIAGLPAQTQECERTRRKESQS